MLRRYALLLTLACAGIAVAQPNLAGTYKGKWTGGSAGGDFTIRLEQTGGDWKATVQFSIADTAIPTTVKTLRVAGARVEVAYEFDLGGNKLQSQLEGDIKDGALSGKYKTKAVADGSAVDEGTCEAKRAE
ncbi:MAG: hypothetical protein HY820_35685 [Acidobacteria bacterium]|nr:hypothetical protein [Acidobacteriota bacterium]